MELLGELTGHYGQIWVLRTVILVLITPGRDAPGMDPEHELPERWSDQGTG